ncbi:MAG: hypothetical protein DGJ47_000090 [Rickettsiaceae bacterium]
MYITCPECDTKFSIDEEQLGSKGRKVKCSTCQNVWHQMKEEKKVKDEEALTPKPLLQKKPELEKGVNLPVVMQEKTNSHPYQFPIIMIGLIVILMVILFPINSYQQSFFKARSLQVKHISVDKDLEQGKLVVSYKIKNNSSQNIQVPLVRVRLLDENNKVIKTATDDHSKITLSASKSISVKTEFKPIPKASKSIDVTVGNQLDLLLK